MFSRLGKLIRGIFSSILGGLESSNPKALLQNEIDSLQESTAHYNKGLAKQAGEIERLKMQIARDKSELDKLKARISAQVNAGNTAEAGRLAMQAKILSEGLAANQNTCEGADKMYVNLTKQRDVYTKDAQNRIEKIKQKMSQAEIAESQAKLAEIASSVSFDLAGSGANLERLEGQLNERVAEAMGKARVASDAVAGGDWKAKADEDAAMEAAALAEFMGMQGMANPAGTRPLPANAAAEGFRELGPG